MHGQRLYYVIGPLNRGADCPENAIALITNAHDVNMYANVCFPLAAWVLF